MLNVPNFQPVSIMPTLDIYVIIMPTLDIHVSIMTTLTLTFNIWHYTHMLKVRDRVDFILTC
jgi:hypothetical protein